MNQHFTRKLFVHPCYICNH